MSTTDMPAAADRRLSRARDGRVIAGVCEGAARYFDIDPVIFRIVLAVLTVFGGAGLVIYALAWVLIPDEGSPRTYLEQWLTSGHFEFRRILLLLLLAICVVIFLGNTNVFAHRTGAAAVAVLAALLLTDLIGRRSGHNLFGSRSRFRTPRRQPLYYGPPTEAASAGFPAAEGFATSTMTMPPPVAERTPRERSWLGWLTFGLVLLASGVLSVIANTDTAHPQPADVLAVCVAICGLGLVAGAVAGRARAMIPLGVLLVLALGFANALPRNLTWTAGTRTWAPVATDVASTYTLGAGDARLDLSQLRDSTQTIDARVGAGLIQVFVPRGAGLVIEGKVSAGEVEVFGHQQSGTGVDIHQVIAPSSPLVGTLTLNLKMGFGEIEVHHA